MMTYWREDKPTLRSERPEGERDRFLIRWQLGLVGMVLEAEDPNLGKAYRRAGSRIGMPRRAD